MLKHLTILIIAIWANITSIGQNLNLSRKINWTSNKAFYYPEKDLDNKNQKLLLSFQNAIYMHENSDLPFYNELIPSNQTQLEVLLQNQVFSKIDNKDLINVVGLNSIPFNIVPITKIVYIRKQPFVQIYFNPIKKNDLTGEIERLEKFEIKLVEKGQIPTKALNKNNYASNSVLKSGKWIKIKIDKSGVYKLTFDQLKNLGIDNPEKTRIFGNGGKMLPLYNYENNIDDLEENKIQIQNNAVYFYAEGPVVWKYDKPTTFFRQQRNLYSEYSWYFISSDYNSQYNNSIIAEQQSQKTVTHQINTYSDFASHEIDTKNLINSGRLWVGEEFDVTTAYSFNFNLPDILNNSTIKLESSLIARSPISSSFSININNQSFTSYFSPVNYINTSTYGTQKIEKFVGNTGTSSNVEIKIKYNKSTASSVGWLDYICLNFNRQLILEKDQLEFRNLESVGIGNTGQFALAQANSQTQILDITNKQRPVKINTSLNGANLNFILNTDSLREFVAFDESNVLTPIITGDGVGLVQNQNLHGTGMVDMIILCHPDFYSQALELKQIHEEYDNLKVLVVTNQQVYNEFSSGSPDVSAIRNFIRMLYNRATTESEMPKYLCLFGDGSFDNKAVSSQNSNFILTYQSENSLSPTESFVTDDFYGFLDESEGGNEGFLDIGIGRLPVRNANEANDAVTKIKNYLNIASYSDWRNNICFVADDEDYNMHVLQADELSTIVKNNYPDFNIEKVYLDAFVQQSSSAGQKYPDASNKIDNLISKGLLIMNYTGHGNEKQLSEEAVFTIDQINKYDNIDKLSILMTATCEFSRFDDYTKTTAGEFVFLNPKGAAIALFTTTRLVYASPNFELNKNFYKYIFENNPLSGSRYTLGDVMRLTKNASGGGINKLNFTLLGDPALKLSYARHKIKTLTINGIDVNVETDTLKAFQKVVVTGEVQDKSGTKISGYNGLIYPIVFDKKENVNTLNNDGEGSFTYSIMNSQVFKGKASVKDGAFEFTFIVPKDIRYNIDSGKMSYYSTNFELQEDAKGSFNNFRIGGVSGLNTSDKTGPALKLYINDEQFVNGGITNKTPKLLVFLSDSSGINTTGNGIGHDIVATIDDNPELKFTINDYYESDTDNFMKGKIRYNLPELTIGEHKLHLKAWDTFNNSSEDSLFFTVSSSNNLEINHVLNYPNPFSTNTSFFFEHNRPNELLDVIIHIFTVSGKIIKTIHSEITSTGYRINGISWDGKDDFGNKPGRGVYFYKISVRTTQGETVNKIEKLLILN